MKREIEEAYMETWQIILLIIGIYFTLLIVYSLFIYLMIERQMGKRADKNPLLFYFSAKDYAGLKTKPLSFTNNKGDTLIGKIYYRDEKQTDEVIVFFHGFGAGHEAYTTLINDLVTTNGMPVLTFDYTGCDLSGGAKIPNTLQALVDGHHFLAYIQTLPEYMNKKLILIGHSWGGFVAANLYPFNKDKNISKVISINGVTDFGLLYRKAARAPYLFIVLNNLINLFKYQKFALATTRKSILNTPIPHLFLHGLKDEAIPFTPFISSLVLQTDKHKTIKFHFDKEKHHNIYLTNESEQNLIALQSDLKLLAKNKADEVLQTKIKTLDYTKLVENDPRILEIINNFIKE